ncbi:hypothetical protein [Streptomyces althioticus]|uniref:hypothetical protein n=1 Tax=Streptomyces althioticus TaxID=83380 RepID=UPI00367A5BC6
MSVSGWGTRAAGALTGLVLLVGCREAAPDAAGGTAAVASPVRTTGYGAVFLDVGECSSFGRTSFTEVSCRSERAAARVVARHDGTTRDGPPCPPATDFVLHISERWPAADEDGDGMVPRGHACMRNLQPPHPGDPGGGGGPRTVVGDCVYALAGGKVRETACDGSGPRRPEFKVTKGGGGPGGWAGGTAPERPRGGAAPRGGAGARGCVL